MSNELKPVYCGCGGEAIIYINGARQAKIYCEKCGIESNVFATKYEAITVWNRAMGERTAKATLLTPDSKSYWSTNGRCQGCGFLLERKHAYCPNCGARLEWR